jgi:hypothetical protein
MVLFQFFLDCVNLTCFRWENSGKLGIELGGIAEGFCDISWVNQSGGGFISLRCVLLELVNCICHGWGSFIFEVKLLS